MSAGMTLIERVAGRFGFFRPAPLATELIVFPSFEAAQECGFRGERHPDHRHLSAWWPGRGPAGLAGRPIQRVTISRHMTFTRTSEGSLVAILRSRQATFGGQSMWIEL